MLHTYCEGYGVMFDIVQLQRMQYAKNADSSDKM